MDQEFNTEESGHEGGGGPKKERPPLPQAEANDPAGFGATIHKKGITQGRQAGKGSLMFVRLPEGRWSFGQGKGKKKGHFFMEMEGPSKGKT